MSRKTIAWMITLLLTITLPARQVLAWGCCRSCSGCGNYGGSFSHSSSTSGGWGGYSHSGSSSFTTADGRSYSGSHSSYGSYGYGGSSYHGSYSGYHGCYSSGGCYGGGFGVGLATGAVVGAAVASSAQPAYGYGYGDYDYDYPTTYAYPDSGVYVAPPPVVETTPAIGATISVLPMGCASTTVNGQQYYQYGSVWYRPVFGSNGVYYQVVAQP